MAVMSLRWLVAVSAWLPAVSAGMQREQPNLWVPTETYRPKPEAEIELGFSPVITPRPVARVPVLDVKRNPNTCGYLNGVKASSSAYVCNHPDAVCLYNSMRSAVGCCLETGCNIWLTCLGYSSSAQLSTVDRDRTMYCSDSKKPYCASLVYYDDIFTGYTIPTCAEEPTSFLISYSSSTDDETSTSTRSSSTTEESTSTEEPTTTAAPPRPTSDGSNNNDDFDGDSDRDRDNGSRKSSSSTPVGAIVGGVVGGVAAIGLIALGVFFLIRKKNQGPDPAAAAAQGGPPGAPGGAPGMAMMPPPTAGHSPGQQPAYPQHMPASPQPSDMASVMGVAPPPNGAAAGYYDPHYSMAKPPLVDPSTGISPTASPAPPVYPAAVMHHPHSTPSPPPPPHMQQPTPPVPFGAAYQGAPPQGIAELPTQRGDGQVYEMDSTSAR